MATVKMDIERMRSVASGLSSTATTVESKYNSLSSAGSALGLSTQPLADVPGYVQDLRDQSTYIDGKVDWIILISSGGSGSFPDSGEVSYDVPGGEPDTLEEVETALGEVMAGLGSDLATSDHKKGDPRLSVLKTYLEKWGGRDRVVTTMYDQLGPEGALALTESVGNHVGLAYQASDDESDDESDEESESAQNTLELIKSSLYRASNAWPDDKAHEFGAGLVEAARRPDLKSPYSDNGISVRTESLTWLLYDAGDASGSFVLGAAEKIDEIQKEDDAYGVPGGWMWLGPSRFLPAVIDEADEGWALDAPSVALHALSEHPTAAYTFFNDDAKRIKYWTAEHDYGSFGDLSGAAAALDVASTDPSLTRSRPAETASIAALAIDGFASRDRFGPADRTDQGVEAAQSLEHILETYMPSVVDSYGAPQTAGNRPAADVNGDKVPDLLYNVTTPVGEQVKNSPWFDSASLDRVLGVVGRDGQALLDFRLAVNEAEVGSMPEGTTRDEFEVVARSWGAVEGAIANAIGTGSVKNAKADDEYAMAWIELAGMPASEISGLASRYAPPGLGKGAGWGAGAMVDWLKEQAVDTWASSASDEKEYQDAAADQAYSDLTLRLLFAADRAGLNGYQNPESGETLDGDSLGSAVRKNPDGSFRLITAEEFEGLSPDEQGRVRASLVSLAGSTDGMGTMVSSLQPSFEVQFLQRYP